MTIKNRNLHPEVQNQINAGMYNVGWNGGGRYKSQGGFWYCDPAGSSNGSGKDWDNPIDSITTIMALNDFEPWDTIFCAPGNHTGDHATPLNADAAFCSIIGMRQTSLGLAAWAGSTTSTEPTIQVRARGWRISGFEFDCPSADAGIQLYKEATLANRCDYTQIDHNLFTGGRAGIHMNGGGTYIHIHDNQFDLMSQSSARVSGAICAIDTGYQLGGLWKIENNFFMENIWHINMGASWGLNSSMIHKNVFQLTGNGNTALVMLDLRGGAGNVITENHFGCTKAEYGDDSSTAFIRTSGSDIGSGNMCDDGIPSIDISS